jgi:hypothetical protein
MTIVSLRMTGIINAAWTLLVIVLAVRFVPDSGATAAAAIYLTAHFVSAIAVLAALRNRRGLPEGMMSVFLLCAGGSFGLAITSWLRAIQPQLSMRWTAALIVITGAVLAASIILGRRHGWLPRQLR